MAIVFIAAGGVLIHFRKYEEACSDYSYGDAVRYVTLNLSKPAMSSPSPQNKFWSAAVVCSQQTAQNTRISDGPYFVDICDMQNGRVVGHAEVYADCGLEWRRH